MNIDIVNELKKINNLNKLQNKHAIKFDINNKYITIYINFVINNDTLTNIVNYNLKNNYILYFFDKKELKNIINDYSYIVKYIYNYFKNKQLEVKYKKLNNLLSYIIYINDKMDFYNFIGDIE